MIMIHQRQEQLLPELKHIPFTSLLPYPMREVGEGSLTRQKGRKTRKIPPVP